jgi:hypothetical protein
MEPPAIPGRFKLVSKLVIPQYRLKWYSWRDRSGPKVLVKKRKLSVIVPRSGIDLFAPKFNALPKFRVKADVNVNANFDGVIEPDKRNAPICVAISLEVTVCMANQFQWTTHPRLNA